MVLLPRIWDFVKLQVLSMSACYLFDIEMDKPTLIAEETKLENLRVLGNLMVSFLKDTMGIFKRLFNL